MKKIAFGILVLLCGILLLPTIGAVSWAFGLIGLGFGIGGLMEQDNGTK